VSRKKRMAALKRLREEIRAGVVTREDRYICKRCGGVVPTAFRAMHAQTHRKAPVFVQGGRPS